MSADIDAVLSLLVPDFINKNVLMKHDVARESYRNVPITVPDFQAFANQIAEYVKHHHTAVGDGTPSSEAAFGEAKRILSNVFADDPYQEGYNVALQMGLGGAGGGMRAILNEIAEQLKRQGLHNYKDYIFNTQINVLSQADNERLAKAYFDRFRDILKRFLPHLDEKTFAGNVRAALEYHLQVVEDILRVARKL